MQDKLIGAAFKGLARAFVALADVDKLKKENIRRLERMDENKFRKRFAKVYEAVRELPESLRSAYGISEHMSRQQAINAVELLDKKRIYAIIDSVPDAAIAGCFRRSLGSGRAGRQGDDAIAQINAFWDKAVTGAVKGKREYIDINACKD